VALDPLIINRDDIPKPIRCNLSHDGSFLLSWLRLATFSSAMFGPYTAFRRRGPLKRCGLYLTELDLDQTTSLCDPLSSAL
jgi:hypothetical protein